MVYYIILFLSNWLLGTAITPIFIDIFNSSKPGAFLRDIGVPSGPILFAYRNFIGKWIKVKTKTLLTPNAPKMEVYLPK